MKACKNVVHILFCVYVLIGCTSTRNARFRESDSELVAQNYNNAIRAIEEEDSNSSLYPNTDRVLRFLDLGMLHFYAGNYSNAQEYLTNAEYLMEELFSESITQAIASFLVNDTVIDYAGEPYEELYTNVFKAISFIEEENFESAFVEIRRLNDKLNLLEDKYADLAQRYSRAENNELTIEAGTSEFYNSALGRYLSMLMYRAEGSWDDARIDAEQFQQAFQNQPNVYNFAPPDISGYLEDSGQARINVLAFTGRIPEKRKSSFLLRTAVNEIIIIAEIENERGGFTTVVVDNIFWPGMEPNFQVRFELPMLEKRGSNVERIEVLANNVARGELHLIESIENVAFESYKVKEPIIYLKTISRAVIKGILSSGIESAVSEQEAGLGFLLGLFTDALVAVSEQADIRYARYLPAFAYGGELLLEPGEYTLSLNYYNERGNLLYTEELERAEYQLGEFYLYYKYVPE